MQFIATLLCLLFVGWLFRVDITQRGDLKISWVPLVWMFICGSRFVSSWLNLTSPGSVEDYGDGSALDRAVFAVLIIWGAAVLYRRRLEWLQLIRKNWSLALYFLFCLSSILWTDEPFILLRRWIKDLGNPIIALVMLTAAPNYEAVGITLRRLSFLLLPLSVLFVRYYPELGRGYDAQGSPMYTGIGQQKNSLGMMCLAAGIYYAWKVLVKRRGDEPVQTPDRYDAILVGMVAYLLYMSNSQTSLVCLLTAVGLFLASRVPVLSKKPARLVLIAAVAPVLFAVFDTTLGLKDGILTLLGRDATLTNRTDLWELVTAHQVDPVVGAGFMSFWAGERMASIWSVVPGVVQAHSGYVEQYLNLGYLGVAFIFLLIVVALVRIWQQMDHAPSAALLRLCLLTVAVLYNYTEASFYGANNMWVLFLVACIEPPPTERKGPAPQRVVPRALTSKQSRLSPRAGPLRRPQPRPASRRIPTPR